MHKTFRHWILSETAKSPPTKFFGIVRQKKIDKKFFVIPRLWFTQTLAPSNWATPTLNCSGLVYYTHVSIQSVHEGKNLPLEEFNFLVAFWTNWGNLTKIVRLSIFNKPLSKWFHNLRSCTNLLLFRFCFLQWN